MTFSRTISVTVFLDNFLENFVTICQAVVCVRKPEMDLIYGLEKLPSQLGKIFCQKERETLSFIRNILVPTRMGICMRKET